MLMMCILVSCFFIPLSTYAATTHTVTVGPGDIFTPQNVTASPGDTITWNWAGGDHDVVQTDSAGSCSKSTDSSAFQSTVSPSSYSVTVNKTSGFYYYMCSVGNHCANGMWGVILISGSGSTPSGSAAPASPTGGSSSGDGSPTGGSSSSSSPKVSSGTKNVNNFMVIYGTILACILAFLSGMLY
ncbi:869_t:CDS:2 [Dentiscutata erythropus]|uniref:869_t:CDS:1 n=1 Tax=Dentiscutata erythropus TaxID=1348616 RepID=A0A9N8Z738_9GLOM|nr:869_t:CDS:2 [Dentiscutata erythropus]